MLFDTSTIPPGHLIVLGLILACGGSFQQGYMLALLNPTKFVIDPFANQSFEKHYDRWLQSNEFNSLWSTLVSNFVLGGMFGAIALPVIANKLGRRNGIYLMVILSIIFVTFEGVAKYVDSWELYFAMRFLMGGSVGTAVGLQSLYMTEVTPKNCRGFTNMMVFAGMAVMEMIASVVGLRIVLGTSDEWAILHFIQVPVLTVPIIFLLRYSESPKHLYACGKVDQARKAIKEFYGEDVDTEHVINEIRAELHVHKMSLLEIFRDHNIRKAAAVSSVLSFGTGFCGGLVVVFYASTLLKQIGMDATTATYLNIPLTGSIFLAATFVTFTADNLGRRPLTLVGAGSLILTNTIALILSVLFDKLSPDHDVGWLGYLFLVDAIFILLAFGSSMAPIALFIGAELAPQNARSGVQSIAVFVRNISMFAAGAIFHPLKDIIGGYAFFLFIIPMIFVFIFLYFTMAETKMRTYPEILAAYNSLPGGLYKSRPVPQIMQEESDEPGELKPETETNGKVEKY